jgi:hypothetical protein
MAGRVESRQETSIGIQVPEQVNDIELDDSMDSSDASLDNVGEGKVIFAKSTDIRRRLEEKLEVKLLKEQLGVDDLGF